jgi:ribosomal protein S18 acetylase RimI-like enzyme
MTDKDLGWRAEAAFRAAWPAHEEISHGDWCLRFAQGVSRRANSVNALGPEAGDVAEIAVAAEAAYAARGLPPIFRVTGLLDPAIDAELAARGYQCEGATTTLYLPLMPWPMRRDPDVAIEAIADEAWFAEMARLQGWSEARLAVYRAIVGRVAATRGFFSLRIGGDVVASAFAVIHDGIACVESVVSDPTRRRQGHGRRLLGALLAWAIENEASGAALQVEAGNAPAIALYRGMGFLTELYPYHYRVKA